jgi:hypothetical protein
MHNIHRLDILVERAWNDGGLHRGRGICLTGV